MAVSYKRLFHLLIERDMTTSQLQNKRASLRISLPVSSGMEPFLWIPLNVFAAR